MQCWVSTEKGLDAMWFTKIRKSKKKIKVFFKKITAVHDRFRIWDVRRSQLLFRFFRAIGAVFLGEN
jgi:hypothetical protein